MGLCTVSQIANMSPDPPPTGLDAENRHVGEHLGNLQYHVEVLADELDSMEQELDSIRSSIERARRRYKQTQNQIGNVAEHLDDEAIEFAERVRDSSLQSHRDEDGDEDGSFTQASDL